MGLVLLRKGSQSFIGPVFTLFDPSTSVSIDYGQKEMGVIVNNCRQICNLCARYQTLEIDELDIQSSLPFK